MIFFNEILPLDLRTKLFLIIKCDFIFIMIFILNIETNYIKSSFYASFLLQCVV